MRYARPQHADTHIGTRKSGLFTVSVTRLAALGHFASSTVLGQRAPAIGPDSAAKGTSSACACVLRAQFLTPSSSATTSGSTVKPEDIALELRSFGFRAGQTNNHMRTADTSARTKRLRAVVSYLTAVLRVYRSLKGARPACTLDFKSLQAVRMLFHIPGLVSHVAGEINCLTRHAPIIMQAGEVPGKRSVT